MSNKKSIINKSELPLVDNNNQYYVKYRVVQNTVSVSDWSPMYKVNAEPVVVVSGVIRLANGVVDITWQNTNHLNSHDIFVRYDTSDPYVFHGRTSANNYSIIPDQGHTKIYILVQAATYSKAASTGSTNLVKIYEGSQDL
jgi:hypothetical protein